MASKDRTSTGFMIISGGIIYASISTTKSIILVGAHTWIEEERRDKFVYHSAVTAIDWSSWTDPRVDQCAPTSCTYTSSLHLYESFFFFFAPAWNKGCHRPLWFSALLIAFLKLYAADYRGLEYDYDCYSFIYCAASHYSHCPLMKRPSFRSS